MDKSNLVLTLEQRQALSIQQVESLELLGYSNQELESFLTTEYLENPMLESSDDKQSTQIQNIEQMYEKSTSYGEHYKKWADDDSNRQQDIAASNTEDLAESLLLQLNKADFSEEQWNLIPHLIRGLDEDGFFPYEPREFAEVFHTDKQTVEICLESLKTLEPAGIFAKDIAECLRLQLRERKIVDEQLLQMIDNCMPDILGGHIERVTRKLKLSTAKVKEYIHLIGGLNPRPVLSRPSIGVQYIIPDILVTLEDGHWQVELNDSWFADYTISDYYLPMIQQTKDESLKEYFTTKLQRARFIIDCVEQRRKTLIKVVHTILEIQDSYFKLHKELVPMTMEEVAAKTDCHVSTVSRAVKDKYLQYQNTVLLRDLFTASASVQEQVSADGVKSRIRCMVQEECSTKPLSDQEIAEKLLKEGMKVSRRTVAKYRMQMGIPESRQRRFLR